MLQLDSRNFHCWRHRLWASQRISEQSAEQLQFNTSMINQDLSNFSAWHYRTALLSQLSQPKEFVSSNEPLEILKRELEVVHSAVFTEPEDQSPWFYYRWLVSVCHGAVHFTRTLPQDEANKFRGDVLDLVKAEIALCDELLQLEPGSKWPTLSKVFLLAALREPGTPPSAETIELIDQLKTIDPFHVGFYQTLQ
eukprot:c4530_g1_i2.p1 GENE.c4530_g1_i2~~c4530_g1_i2.p1  ORF type:complete len:195 (+),score=42.84 c4530_g1_i2:492-1076(+)